MDTNEDFKTKLKWKLEKTQNIKPVFSACSLLPGVRVRCLADSPDIVPWWVRTEDCKNR